MVMMRRAKQEACHGPFAERPRTDARNAGAPGVRYRRDRPQILPAVQVVRVALDKRETNLTF
jgi:hypothetical protein